MFRPDWEFRKFYFNSIKRADKKTRGDKGCKGAHLFQYRTLFMQFIQLFTRGYQMSKRGGRRAEQVKSNFIDLTEKMYKTSL